MMKPILKEIIEDMNLSNLTIKQVEGIPLLMPEILALNWPDHLPLSDFPNFCGAGEGLQEWIIPETFYFQSQRHNCFIHDVTHTIFPPTRAGFYMSNQILLSNCLSTIRVKSNWFLKYPRERRALKYYDGVETNLGFQAFINRPGGNHGQKGYSPLEDPSFMNLLKKVGVKKPWAI